jgi:hypothetical protein
MERVIDFIFDQFLKEFLGEGERRIKLQAFSACLSAVLGVRRLFIIVYIACFTCFLSAMSFFAASYLAYDQWLSGHPNFLEPRLLFCTAIFLLSTLALARTVRERQWAQAFRLEERIRELERTPVSEQDLARMIERIIEEKLNKSQDKAA